MTVEETKRFFNFCRRLDVRIQSKADEQARYRELAAKASPSYSGMPSGCSGNRIEFCALRIIELEREINEEIDRLIDCRRIAMKVLEQIDDDRYCDILCLRYLSGYTWDKIKERLHYESTQVWRLHGFALLAAQKGLDQIVQNSEKDRAVIYNIIGRSRQDGIKGNMNL